MTLTLYIAGPLFTPYHRGFHARNAARLRSEGFICLVPHERVVAAAFHRETGFPVTPVDVYRQDYAMIKEADAIIALLDDPDISSGLASEIGIFWAMMQQDVSKKGVLGLLTDDRTYQRMALGLPGIGTFTLDCILSVGAIYREIEDVVSHLHTWDQGLEK